MSRLLLPALRGHVGDWVFYCSIMPLVEIGRRVSYADEIHKNKHLSDMIQRVLQETRAAEIADYLATQEQRFFNSLVLAVYDSDPVWYPVKHLEGRYRDIDIEEVEDRIETLGLLELSPSLKMFAIDGQHRLAGIKLLLKETRESKEDQLPVVLVGHKRTAKGFERTRRLFTTLNKTAKNVSKSETIALDEDDTAAIVVRRLVEEHPYFIGERIAFRAKNNLPPENRNSLTTLGNLYDVSWEVIRKIHTPTTGVPDKRVRPSNEVIEECRGIIINFFDALGTRFPPIASFLRTKHPARVVMANRHSRGGHILFRPIGLNIFTELVAELRKTKSMEISVALDAVGRLPVELGKKPYSKILWDPGRRVMTLTGKTIVRDLLRLAIGLPARRDSVRKKLAGWLGIAVADVDLSAWIPNAGTRRRKRTRRK